MFCLCPQQVTTDWSSPNLATVSPEAFEVEPYCETPLAPFQIQRDLLTENATWLRKADGLSPQIHGPCLTPWQHEMNLTPRRLWNTKNILETFPVLDTTHMNTWKLSVTIATPPPPEPQRASPSKPTDPTLAPRARTYRPRTKQRCPSGPLTLKVKTGLHDKGTWLRLIYLSFILKPAISRSLFRDYVSVILGWRFSCEADVHERLFSTKADLQFANPQRKQAEWWGQSPGLSRIKRGQSAKIWGKIKTGNYRRVLT